LKALVTLPLDYELKIDYSDDMDLKKRIASISGLKIALVILVIFIVFLFSLPVIFYFWASSGSLPENKRSEIFAYSDTIKEPPADRDVFTVMTYNIGYLSGMTNNRAVKRKKGLFEKNMKRFLQMLNKKKPDVIGFQEIDFHSRRSFYVNQMRTIAKKAGYKYGAAAINWDKHYVPFPYWPPSVHFGEMLSGQAVLSQWPILSAKRVVLQKPKNKPFYYNAFYLDRLVQAVKVKIKNRELMILNVHLEAFDRETRENQATKVLEIYRTFKDDYPVLLMGDFNCVPPGTEQKKNFRDEPETNFSNEKTITFLLEEKSLKAAELSFFTFPSDKPVRKLDYIFYNHEKIVLIKVFAPEMDSSDHLPVVMQFSLVDKGPAKHAE
jgi:endonuclease/exonuclease/phosphatase family metal-dependent hydrolase